MSIHRDILPVEDEVAITAAVIYHCRWTFRLVVALSGLLSCVE
jgi:hypothetical protein